MLVRASQELIEVAFGIRQDESLRGEIPIWMFEALSTGEILALPRKEFDELPDELTEHLEVLT